MFMRTTDVHDLQFPVLRDQGVNDFYYIVCFIHKILLLFVERRSTDVGSRNQQIRGSWSSSSISRGRSPPIIVFNLNPWKADDISPIIAAF